MSSVNNNLDDTNKQANKDRRVERGSRENDTISIPTHDSLQDHNTKSFKFEVFLKSRCNQNRRCPRGLEYAIALDKKVVQCRWKLCSNTCEKQVAMVNSGVKQMRGSLYFWKGQWLQEKDLYMLLGDCCSVFFVNKIGCLFIEKQ